MEFPPFLGDLLTASVALSSLILLFLGYVKEHYSGKRSKYKTILRLVFLALLLFLLTILFSIISFYQFSYHNEDMTKYPLIFFFVGILIIFGTAIYFFFGKFEN